MSPREDFEPGMDILPAGEGEPERVFWMMIDVRMGYIRRPCGINTQEFHNLLMKAELAGYRVGLVPVEDEGALVYMNHLFHMIFRPFKDKSINKRLRNLQEANAFLEDRRGSDGQ
jgi:hypothetical protein